MKVDPNNAISTHVRMPCVVTIDDWALLYGGMHLQTPKALGIVVLAGMRIGTEDVVQYNSGGIPFLTERDVKPHIPANSGRRKEPMSCTLWNSNLITHEGNDKHLSVLTLFHLGECKPLSVATDAGESFATLAGTNVEFVDPSSDADGSPVGQSTVDSSAPLPAKLNATIKQRSRSGQKFAFSTGKVEPTAQLPVGRHLLWVVQLPVKHYLRTSLSSACQLTIVVEDHESPTFKSPLESKGRQTEFALTDSVGLECPKNVTLSYSGKPGVADLKSDLQWYLDNAIMDNVAKSPSVRVVGFAPTACLKDEHCNITIAAEDDAGNRRVCNVVPLYLSLSVQSDGVSATSASASQPVDMQPEAKTLSGSFWIILLGSAGFVLLLVVAIGGTLLWCQWKKPVKSETYQAPTQLVLGDLVVDISSEVLGVGSQSIVYKAVDSTGRTLAVKRCKAVKAALTEYQMMGKISHPNVIKVIGVQAQDVVTTNAEDSVHSSAPLRNGAEVSTSSVQPQPHQENTTQATYVYVIMEFMSGGTLQNLLDNTNQKLTPVAISKYAKDILAGLEAIHSTGFVHCDIKPGNLLLNEEGVCKIGDLGVARRVDSGTVTSVQSAGALFYTPPECIGENPCSPTQLGDIWMFGLCMLQLRTGKLPWDGCTSTETLFGNITKMKGAYWEIGPDDPSGLWKTFPVYADFLHCCLQKNPKDRWTAKQLRQHGFIKNPDVIEAAQPTLAPASIQKLSMNAGSCSASYPVLGSGYFGSCGRVAVGSAVLGSGTGTGPSSLGAEMDSMDFKLPRELTDVMEDLGEVDLVENRFTEHHD
eukprot:TRINITY_DN17988_c0_g1_i1.p1 TRINITY_DN17988_c0_g1~~TRINITY_DN17988_c0_g1_i1.p1  ORF type:complete len:904 (+),score=19.37 TRINITY_DN17988_c0_g1_i1:271-2712(+)